LFDVESGLVIREFRGASDALHSASFDRRGDRIVTASADDFARVYRTRPARRGAILAEHAAACTSLTVSATHVCATTQDGFLLLADPRSQTDARRSQFHARAIEGVDIAPDGRRAVTQPQYESSKVIDLDTGTVLYEAHGEEPNRVARF